MFVGCKEFSDENTEFFVSSMMFRNKRFLLWTEEE